MLVHSRPAVIQSTVPVERADSAVSRACIGYPVGWRCRSAQMQGLALFIMYGLSIHKACRHSALRTVTSCEETFTFSSPLPWRLPMCMPVQTSTTPQFVSGSNCAPKSAALNASFAGALPVLNTATYIVTLCWRGRPIKAIPCRCARQMRTPLLLFWRISSLLVAALLSQRRSVFVSSEYVNASIRVKSPPKNNGD